MGPHSWEKEPFFVGELCLAYAGMSLWLQDLTMLFYVKTSMDTVNSAIRMAAQGDGDILATLAAS